MVSSSIKNGAVKSSDLKNGGIKGKDVKDATITGVDVAAGTIKDLNLAPDAVDEVHTYFYAAGTSDNVVWSDPDVGTITFSYDCSTFAVNSFVSAVKSPARAGTYGVEDINQGSEPAGNPPLVGAATVSRLNDVGQPVGGAGFGGSKFGLGQLVLFIQSARVDVYVDLKISLCSTSCEKSGVAYCTEPEAG